MELVYLWVEEYKNIKNQGFNFSPRFTCKYDEAKKELTIEEKKDYVSIFPPNINVTAIVGENGSGKSSLLENIISRANFGLGSFLVYYIDYKFYVHSNFKIFSNQKLLYFKDSLLTEYESEYEGKYNLGYITFDLLKEKNIFLFRSVEDYIEEHNDEDESIFSYQNLLFKVLKDNENKDKLNINNYSKNIYLFLLNNLNNNVNFFVFQPSEIEFNIKNFSLNDGGTFKVPEIYKDKKNWTTRYHDIKAINFYVQYKIKYIDIELKLYLFILLKNLALNQEETYHLLVNEKFDFGLFNKKYPNEQEILIEIKRVIYKIISWTDYHNLFDFFYGDTSYKITDFLYEDVIKKLKTFFNQGNRKTIKFQKLSKDLFFLSYFFYVGFIEINIFDKNKRNLKKLSHGEKNYFIVEVLLFDKVFSSREKNLVFLLDEIENNFHPNWQKKLGYNLFNSLSQFKEKKFHIIATSHSPFLLSDLPKENVIFLENGKQVYPNIETFGANIHTLLSHGFFMKDGLMGEFAKEKINEVIDYLNGKASPIKDDDEAQRYVCIIGEPIVKRQLQRMLDSKKLDKMKEIDALKNQIESLKNRLDILVQND